MKHTTFTFLTTFKKNGTIQEWEVLTHAWYSNSSKSYEKIILLLKQITTILRIKLQVGRFPLSNHRFRNNDRVKEMCQNGVLKSNFCTPDVIKWRNTCNRFRILFLSLQKQNCLIHFFHRFIFIVQPRRKMSVNSASGGTKRHSFHTIL